ncbi:unnamed protein product [Mesocestoides corti]|uniref:Uncharacterized protein n=1 Tax=Mesocestoides corti TaxID=53468 RepID=A0A0R3UQ42_MESCO|nr:unnamed protein product [Mesocestoides corti]
MVLQSKNPVLCEADTSADTEASTSELPTTRQIALQPGQPQLFCLPPPEFATTQWRAAPPVHEGGASIEEGEAVGPTAKSQFP